MSDTAFRTGLGIVGAIGGFILGGPVGAAIGLAAGGILGAFLFPPEGQRIEGPRLDNLQVTSSAYGRPIYKHFGTMRMGGNVTMSPGLVEHRHEEEVGGKGAPSVTQVTYTYTVTFRWDCCEGPVDAFLKVFADGKLLADLTTNSIPTSGLLSVVVSKLSPGQQTYTIFYGTEDQEPWSVEEALYGVGNVSAYRGIAGLGFENMPVADFGNRIPQITAVVSKNATENFTYDTTAESTTLEFALWGPNYSYFISSNGVATTSTIFKENNITQSLEGQFSLKSDNNFMPDIDEAGNLYVIYDPLPFTNHFLRKYSGDTLALLDTITIPNTPYKSIRTSGNIGILPRNSGTIIQTITLNPFDALDTYDIGYNLVKSMTVDGEGNIWGNVANDGSGNTLLLKFSNASGGLLGIFTVSGDIGGAICYESISNSIIIGNGSSLLRWSIDSETVEARLDGITFNLNSNLNNFWQGPLGGTLYIFNNITVFDDFTAYDVINMEVIREYDNTDWGLGADPGGRFLYDPIHHAVIRRNEAGPVATYWYYLGRFSASEITVKSVVDAISEDVGVTSALRDTTELASDTIHGYIVDRRMSAKAALDPLGVVYGFRSVESERKVKFIKRGGSAEFAISEEQLNAVANPSDVGPPLRYTRGDEREIPRLIDMRYSNPNRDYEIEIARHQRPREAVTTRKEIEVDFPGALKPGPAVRRVETMLYLAWLELVRVQALVDWQWLEYDGGDVGTITADGETHTVEIIDLEYGANGQVLLDAFLMESEAATETSRVGTEGTDYPTKTLLPPYTSILHLMDTTLMSDLDEGYVIYESATNRNSSYPGTVVYKSSDDGDTYSQWDVIPTEAQGTDGVTTETLAAPSKFNVWDRVSTVNVRFYNYTPASVTELQALNGSNTFIIGEEKVTAATVTPESDGTYTLSDLIRGRQGTEWAASSHVTGEYVIHLTVAKVERKELPTSEIGVDKIYRPVTVGLPFSTGVNQTLTFAANSKRPWSVASLKAVKETNNDWTITWKRRARYGNKWLDYIDVPLQETQEKYRLDFMNGATVQDTATVTDTETYTWTEAEQISSFGSEQPTIDLSVYQLGDNDIEGFAASLQE